MKLKYTKTTFILIALAFIFSPIKNVDAHCGKCKKEDCKKEDCKKKKCKDCKHKISDITINDLKKAIDKKKVFLIDANGTKSFNTSHIPGAVDFQALGKKGLLEKLPKDKNFLIVAYCGGPLCSAYKKPAKVAIKNGYTNVKHFSEGLSGWNAAK